MNDDVEVENVDTERGEKIEVRDGTVVDVAIKVQSKSAPVEVLELVLNILQEFSHTLEDIIESDNRPIVKALKISLIIMLGFSLILTILIDLLITIY